MADAPTPLRMIPSQDDPTDSVIAALERALERARAGEFSAVGIALVSREGKTCSINSETPCAGLLLGAVSRLAHKLNQKMDP